MILVHQLESWPLKGLPGEQVSKCILLSGTPELNRPAELYPQVPCPPFADLPKSRVADLPQSRVLSDLPQGWVLSGTPELNRPAELYPQVP